MLTLQQLLESDSIASLVAKLNANFQTVSNSNGGPQGIRGTQGIPGLPGRLGPTGTTGPDGPMGTGVGIIPFSCIGDAATGIGPDAGQIATNGQPVEPWPNASYEWLAYYHMIGGTGSTGPWGSTPADNDIYIDHANSGYWKYLGSGPDVQGACDGIGGYTSGGYYQTDNTPTATYPNLGTTGGWVGSGWYWYPEPPDTLNSGTVWVNDYSTYLNSANSPTGPYPQGPFPYSITSPLTVANARLITKYGTVWISSSSDNSTIANKDNFLETSDIGLSYPVVSPSLPPGRLNSGVDRLLFKMSLDSIPYLNNITARGYTTASGSVGTPGGASGIYPEDYAADQMVDANFWVRPQYNVTMEKFTPLFFLSERNPDDAFVGNYSSIGLFMHTSAEDNGDLENTHKSLFLWSTRAAKDPTDLYPSLTSPINSSSTENYGEFVMDVRRLIASNQYVCSVPADMRLSGDYISSLGEDQIYDESDLSNTQRYRTFQGYISSINGKSLTGIADAIDYWEFGLGDELPYGTTGGTHDTASGIDNMSTRNTWYGSSVLDQKPSEWEEANIGSNNYIRMAGMMERGRRFNAETIDENTTNFLSELIFYTSHFNTATSALINGKGVTNDLVNPTVNEHKSLPALYMSPYRNIGIGTFVGTSVFNVTDTGPLEPAAQFHVHIKQKSQLDDPTYTYLNQAAGSGKYVHLSPRVYAVAAFSGDSKIPDPEPSLGKSFMTDVLFGNLISANQEYVNPAIGINDAVNPMMDKYGVIATGNNLRNAIRSESWVSGIINTMHFGAQPGSQPSNTIGRNGVESYRNEFQLSLHPLTIEGVALDNALSAITGVGIHNLYPRARTQHYGKNLYNETERGEEQWRPGYVLQDALATGIASLYPYYGVTASNSPSNNQVTIDYIGSSYTYPVGIYDYQYYAYGATANPSSVGTASANASAYPNRDSQGPTRHAVPWVPATVNESYPVTTAGVKYLDSYKHGGLKNGWWEPTSYVGFNIYRDLSAADTVNSGDDKDTTRWILGTADNADVSSGNNGGAALIGSPRGELGIITIPSGRDGGSAYTQWEQRGLGTRDVLNQMKIIFDKNGNIAVGNAAGWDLDAYPSMERAKSSGYLYYVPDSLATTANPVFAMSGNQYNWARYIGSIGAYGKVQYTGYTETGISEAALINAHTTEPEYIRLEVAAEKAWSRDGRMAQKIGWGYPTNVTIVIPDTSTPNYIKFSTADPIGPWTLVTDNEGRIINNFVTDSFGTSSTVDAVVFPHPTEFNLGGPLDFLAPGFSAPVGAIAAEWWGMTTENTPPPANGDYIYIDEFTWTPIPTTDTRGSANVRLNNFVYGEGFGFGTGPQPVSGDTNPDILAPSSYTQKLVKQKRQESPKLILTFLEKDPTAFEADNRLGSTIDPLKKVSTVIQSAQNEASLREYWIPKTDNTGGTFMVFTDHFSQKEKTSGFDKTSIKVETTPIGGETAATGLHLEEVVTQEFLAGYTGTGLTPIDNDVVINKTFLDSSIGYPFNKGPKSMYPGYVRYYNRNYRSLGQQETQFLSTEYGNIIATTSLTNVGTTGIYPGGGKKYYSEWVLFPSQGPSGSNSNVFNTVAWGMDTTDTGFYNPGAGATAQPPKWSNVDDSYSHSIPPGTLTSANPPVGTNDGDMGTWETGNDWKFFPSAILRDSNDSAAGPDRCSHIKIIVDIEMIPLVEIPGVDFGIGFRLLPTSNTSKTDFIGTGSGSGSFGGIINAYGQTTVDGEVLMQYKQYSDERNRIEGRLEFVMDALTWYSRVADGWKLCAMIYLGASLTGSPQGEDSVDPGSWYTFADAPFDIDPDYTQWNVPRMNIKMEEIDAYKGSHGHIDTITPENTVTRAAIQRNIDHFYSIYNPSTNYDNGWGTDSVLNEQGTPVIENKASAIRFKRINSEFALVDYSITVKVDNPRITFTEEETDSERNANTLNMVDQGSPRWTQYLRFIYIPDEAFYEDFEAGRQDLAQDIYGNGMWFSNWSSYKNWLPGTAVVGESDPGRSNSTYDLSLLNGIPMSTSADGGPMFNDCTVPGVNPNKFTRTWTGNFLEMTSHWNDELDAITGKSIFADNNIPAAPDLALNVVVGDINRNDYGSIRSGWGMDRRILNLANRMFPNGIGTAFGNAKRFMYTMGMTYSLMGNRAYSRNRSTSWRMAPANAQNWNSGESTNHANTTNNTFVLEVMFDEPIMHVDTPMGPYMFQNWYNTTEPIQEFRHTTPYQYLTVSGQSIIRYAQTYSANPESLS